ncbi:uncharacterized protein LOC121857252, partial [Homarus americanus]|uniref:uncharacterized protein LOC121857252 n=1 Tax=Homarus americanus TaxID=6706 RepID=UPI001C444DFF
MVHDCRRRSAVFPSLNVNNKLDSEFTSSAALSCLEDYSPSDTMGSRGLHAGYGTLPGPFIPTTPQQREKGTLERRRGPWRDAGFWLRIISPGGTKHLQRRGAANLDLSVKSGTLPRDIKYSSDDQTSPVSSHTTPIRPYSHNYKSTKTPFFTLNHRSHKESTTPFRNLNLEYELGYSCGVWDGSPHTPPPGVFERLTPKSCTLPRDLRCSGPPGSRSSTRSLTSTWGSKRGGKSPGSPWWWRALSPSSMARKIFPERRHSPADVIIEWVDGGVEKKWTRSNSLRRPFHSSRHNTGHQQDPSAHSDTEIGKISAPHSLLDGDSGSVGGSVSSERA